MWGDDAASVPRPKRELKAFRKVTLEPGESREISFELSPRAFAFFDVGAGLWRVERGSFTLSAGFSAADIRGSATLEMAGTTLER